MQRKLPALAFLLVMITLITLRLPVLSYCLCQETIKAGDCGCEISAQQATDPVPAAVPNSGCSGCCSQQIPENTAPEPITTTQSPCNDCIKLLTFDPGDFQSMDSCNSPQKSQLTTPVSWPPSPFLSLVNPSCLLKQSSPRGDPYPPPSPPLYLSLGVLRL